MSDHTGRPTGEGLVLEAWGQGLMIGSLLIMAAITLSNMKKHILLHKLILAEVSIHHGSYIFQFPQDRCTRKRLLFPCVPPTWACTCMKHVLEHEANSELPHTANSRHGSWYLHFPARARLWLVLICYGDRPEYILGTAQCHCVDEESTVSITPSLDVLHRHRHSFLAVLDRRDLCQLHLLQQYQ